VQVKEGFVKHKEQLFPAQHKIGQESLFLHSVLELPMRQTLKGIMYSGSTGILLNMFI